MYVITVELHPGGDEEQAEVVATGKICNLREHEPGSPLGNFHAFFEANEVPASEPAPYAPDDERRTWHLTGSGVTKDYPRRQGGVWDLIATMLQEAGKGRPIVHGGLTLSDIGR